MVDELKSAVLAGYTVGLSPERQRYWKSELHIRSDDRHDRLGLDVHAVHLYVAKIALQFFAAPGDRSTHRVE